MYKVENEDLSDIQGRFQLSLPAATVLANRSLLKKNADCFNASLASLSDPFRFPDMQKTIETKISVIGKVIDPLSRSFFIETKLAPNSDFRPNQLVQVRIKDYSKSNL